MSVSAKVKVENRYVNGSTPLPKVSTGPAGVVIINVTMDRVGIVSSVSVNSGSTITDEEGVTKYFDDVFHKRLILSHHKDLLKGDFLIDDRPKHGAETFDGEWIQFGSERFPDWEAVLKYLI